MKESATSTPPVLYTPFILPPVAYLSYTSTASLFRNLLEALSTNKNWEAVDGGAYQIAILTPTINGVVLPCLGILFATLVSTTIIQVSGEGGEESGDDPRQRAGCRITLGPPCFAKFYAMTTLTLLPRHFAPLPPRSSLLLSQLRNRQIGVRTMLNNEATELITLKEITERIDRVGRRLDLSSDGAESLETGMSLRVLLRKYVSRVLSECRPGTNERSRLSDVSSSDGELPTIQGAAYEITGREEDRMSTMLCGNIVDAISRLNDFRAQR